MDIVIVKKSNAKITNTVLDSVAISTVEGGNSTDTWEKMEKSYKIVSSGG